MSSIDYCPTENMPADLLTKPLQRVLLETLRQNVDSKQLKLIEHLTEEECWHQDFRDAMSDFCHNLMNASITATVDAIIKFSVVELVGNDCKITSYSRRLPSTGTSLHCNTCVSISAV